MPNRIYDDTTEEALDHDKPGTSGTAARSAPGMEPYLITYPCFLMDEDSDDEDEEASAANGISWQPTPYESRADAGEGTYSWNGLSLYMQDGIGAPLTPLPWEAYDADADSVYDGERLFIHARPFRHLFRPEEPDFVTFARYKDAVAEADQWRQSLFSRGKRFVQHHLTTAGQMLGMVSARENPLSLPGSSLAKTIHFPDSDPELLALQQAVDTSSARERRVLFQGALPTKKTLVRALYAWSDLQKYGQRPDSLYVAQSRMRATGEQMEMPHGSFAGEEHEETKAFYEALFDIFGEGDHGVNEEDYQLNADAQNDISRKSSYETVSSVMRDGYPAETSPTNSALRNDAAEMENSLQSSKSDQNTLSPQEEIQPSETHDASLNNYPISFSAANGDTEEMQAEPDAWEIPARGYSAMTNDEFSPISSGAGGLQPSLFAGLIGVMSWVTGGSGEDESVQSPEPLPKTGQALSPEQQEDNLQEKLYVDPVANIKTTGNVRIILTKMKVVHEPALQVVVSEAAHRVHLDFGDQYNVVYEDADVNGMDPRAIALLTYDDHGRKIRQIVVTMEKGPEGLAVSDVRRSQIRANRRWASAFVNPVGSLGWTHDTRVVATDSNSGPAHISLTEPNTYLHFSFADSYKDELYYLENPDGDGFSLRLYKDETTKYTVTGQSHNVLEASKNAKAALAFRWPPDVFINPTGNILIWRPIIIQFNENLDWSRQILIIVRNPNTTIRIEFADDFIGIEKVEVAADGQGIDYIPKADASMTGRISVRGFADGYETPVILQFDAYIEAEATSGSSKGVRRERSGGAGTGKSVEFIRYGTNLAKTRSMKVVFGAFSYQDPGGLARNAGATWPLLRVSPGATLTYTFLTQCPELFVRLISPQGGGKDYIEFVELKHRTYRLRIEFEGGGVPEEYVRSAQQAVRQRWPLSEVNNKVGNITALRPTKFRYDASINKNSRIDFSFPNKWLVHEFSISDDFPFLHMWCEGRFSYKNEAHEGAIHIGNLQEPMGKLANDKFKGFVSQEKNLRESPITAGPGDSIYLSLPFDTAGGNQIERPGEITVTSSAGWSRDGADLLFNSAPELFWVWDPDAGGEGEAIFVDAYTREVCLVMRADEGLLREQISNLELYFDKKFKISRDPDISLELPRDGGDANFLFTYRWAESDSPVEINIKEAATLPHFVFAFDDVYWTGERVDRYTLVYRATEGKDLLTIKNEDADELDQIQAEIDAAMLRNKRHIERQKALRTRFLFPDSENQIHSKQIVVLDRDTFSATGNGAAKMTFLSDAGSLLFPIMQITYQIDDPQLRLLLLPTFNEDGAAVFVDATTLEPRLVMMGEDKNNLWSQAILLESLMIKPSDRYVLDAQGLFETESSTTFLFSRQWQGTVVPLTLDIRNPSHQTKFNFQSGVYLEGTVMANNEAHYRTLDGVVRLIVRSSDGGLRQQAKDAIDAAMNKNRPGISRDLTDTDVVSEGAKKTLVLPAQDMDAIILNLPQSVSNVQLKVSEGFSLVRPLRVLAEPGRSEFVIAQEGKTKSLRGQTEAISTMYQALLATVSPTEQTRLNNALSDQPRYFDAQAGVKYVLPTGYLSRKDRDSPGTSLVFNARAGSTIQVPQDIDRDYVINLPDDPSEVEQDWLDVTALFTEQQFSFSILATAMSGSDATYDVGGEVVGSDSSTGFIVFGYFTNKGVDGRLVKIALAGSLASIKKAEVMLSEERKRLSTGFEERFTRIDRERCLRSFHDLEYVRRLLDGIPVSYRRLLGQLGLDDNVGDMKAQLTSIQTLRGFSAQTPDIDLNRTWLESDQGKESLLLMQIMQYINVAHSLIDFQHQNVQLPPYAFWDAIDYLGKTNQKSQNLTVEHLKNVVFPFIKAFPEKLKSETAFLQDVAIQLMEPSIRGYHWERREKQTQSVVGGKAPNKTTSISVPDYDAEKFGDAVLLQTFYAHLHQLDPDQERKNLINLVLLLNEDLKSATVSLETGEVKLTSDQRWSLPAKLDRSVLKFPLRRSDLLVELGKMSADEKARLLSSQITRGEVRTFLLKIAGEKYLSPLAPVMPKRDTPNLFDPHVHLSPEKSRALDEDRRKSEDEYRKKMASYNDSLLQYKNTKRKIDREGYDYYLSPALRSLNYGSDGDQFRLEGERDGDGIGKILRSNDIASNFASKVHKLTKALPRVSLNSIIGRHGITVPAARYAAQAAPNGETSRSASVISGAEVKAAVKKYYRNHGGNALGQGLAATAAVYAFLESIKDDEWYLSLDGITAAGNAGGRTFASLTSAVKFLSVHKQNWATLKTLVLTPVGGMCTGVLTLTNLYDTAKAAKGVVDDPSSERAWLDVVSKGLLLYSTMSGNFITGAMGGVGLIVLWLAEDEVIDLPPERRPDDPVPVEVPTDSKIHTLGYKVDVNQFKAEMGQVRKVIRKGKYYKSFEWRDGVLKYEESEADSSAINVDRQTWWQKKIDEIDGPQVPPSST